MVLPGCREQTGEVNRSQTTQGATIVLVVLFTMLLLAALLAASSQLTLSSRRSTADQMASLRAQYVAESGVALAQSRLRDVQVLLSPDRLGAGGVVVNHFVVPYTTNKEVLKTQAEAFCNRPGSPSAWVPTPEFTLTSTVDGEARSYPDAQQCTVAAGSNPAQFDLLAQYVQPVAFDIFPVSERPSSVGNYGSRLAWWSGLLAQEQVFGDTRFRLRPLRAVQLTPVKYRFYIGLDTLSARGQQDNATRVLSASRTADSQWWFEIELPSLLDDVLMTNHHRAKPSGTYNASGAPGVNFDDQIFDGSIHTNEKFLFTNDSKAQFKGKVSSVGCTDLLQNGPTASGDCTATAGVYTTINNNVVISTPPSTAATAAQSNKWVADKIASSPRTVQFVKSADDPSKIDYKKTDFSAEYKPLPANENDQKAAAQDGGLELGSALGVELVVGGDNGAALSSYDGGKKSWNEPNPVYQYVRFLKAGNQKVRECSWTNDAVWSDNWDDRNNRWSPDADWNATIDEKRGRQNHSNGRSGYWRYLQSCQNVAEKIVDPDREYRVDKDGNLSRKSGGSWVSQGRKFNGVIYGEKFESLRGPERLGSNKDDGALSNVPPAVASFAGITIASTNHINIDTDLTVSDTPCSFAALKATPPCTKKPQNILGIYSQSGDIVISEKTRRDLNLHAALIASTGQVTTENYSNRIDQGNVNLIGSLIENWYGAFGLVSGAGYGRNFTYDQRLKEGIVPPFFPVSPRWTVAAAAESEPEKSLTNVVLRQASASDF